MSNWAHIPESNHDDWLEYVRSVGLEPGVIRRRTNFAGRIPELVKRFDSIEKAEQQPTLVRDESYHAVDLAMKAKLEPTVS